jgi:hypothetical protein
MGPLAPPDVITPPDEDDDDDVALSGDRASVPAAATGNDGVFPDGGKAGDRDPGDTFPLFVVAARVLPLPFDFVSALLVPASKPISAPPVGS